MANTNYPSTGNTPASQSSNTTSRNVLIGLLAAGLLGTWGYVLYDRNKEAQVKSELRTEVTTAKTEKESVDSLYKEAIVRLDNLTGENSRVRNELVDKDGELKKIKTELRSIINNKNATSADLKRARNLIASLNDKISGLEAEVARLMGENQQLATTNTVLEGEKVYLQTELQNTTTVKEELAQKVDVASTFSASNFNIRGVDERGKGKEKETDKAKKVNKLIVSFDIENRIAQSGPADLYVVVTAPDGQVISNPAMGSGILTTRNDGDRPYSYKTSTEYQAGTRKNIQVPLRQDKFQTGDYKIEVYHNGFKIAEGVRNLRKGGLFG